MHETQEIGPIAGPSVWRVSDIADMSQCTVKLSPSDLKALAAEITVERDMTQLQLQSEPLIRQMAEIYRELKTGRGFVIQEGFPVFDWSEEDLQRAFWVLGSALGTGVSQSVMGDLMGHVRDFTKEDPNARSYRNKRELNPHTDFCDIAALFCLRGAETGGESLLSSAHAVHNSILEQNPGALKLLYDGFYFHRHGEESPGDEPVTPYKVPLFSRFEGQVSSRWITPYVELGQEAKGEPLAGDKLDAVTLFLNTARSEALQLRFTLQPGQILWLNNLTHFHARSAFEDGDDYANRRHLLRLWLDNDDFRPTVPELDIYGTGGGIGFQAGKTPSYNEAEQWQKFGSKAPHTKPNEV